MLGIKTDKLFGINNKKGFASLLGLLLAVAIIGILFYILFNSYFKKPSFDKATEKSLSEQGINTSNYQSILNSTRVKVKDIEKQMLDREKRISE